jgi:hypothetical protein
MQLAYTGQANQGDDYHNLKEMIFIAIAHCIIFPDKPGHIILDKNNYEQTLTIFTLHFIVLPNFPKTKED